MLGGIEILVLCSIVGGVFGIFFRDKKRSGWLGFIIGAIGAAITSYLLASFVFASLIAIPIYSILGSWVFNVIFKKIFDKAV
jgi:uncharacterized membrane protein YeaQ/YmgE (transglycosylase-associated protein family)